MEPSRVRAAFAWAGVVAVALSLVAFPIVDARVRSNYRATGSAGSTDLLALAAKTDAVLATTYGLPLAVRQNAPGATLAVARDDLDAPWLPVRLAGLAGLGSVVVINGDSSAWSEGAELEGNIVASAPREGTANGWALALNPNGDNDVLVAIEGAGSRDLVVSASLLPAFPAGKVAP